MSKRARRPAAEAADAPSLARDHAPRDTRATRRAEARASRSGRASGGGELRWLPRAEPFGPMPHWVWALTIFTFATYIFWINREGLWLDEVNIRYISSFLPISRILRTVHILHLFIARGFLSVLDTPWMVRLPSVLWATASIPVFYLAARALGGPVVGALGALLLALSSYHFNYALDANYYAALIFFAAAGILFTVRFFEHAHFIDLAGAFAFLLLGVGFHPFAALCVFPAIGLIVLRIFTSRRHAAALWPGSGAIPIKPAAGWAMLAVFVLAAAWLVRNQRGRVMGWFKYVREHFEPGTTFLNLKLGPRFFVDYFQRNLIAAGFETPFTVAFLALAFAILLIGLAVCLRRAPWIGAWYLLSVLGGFTLIFNLRADHYFFIRYFSSYLPMHLLLIAMGARELAVAGRAWVWAALALLGGLIAAALAGGWIPFSIPAAIAWALSAGLLLALALRRDYSAIFRRPEFALALALVIPILFAGGQSIVRRMIANREFWNRAVEVWEKEPDRNAIPYVYQVDLEDDLMRYYLGRAGIPFENTRRLIDNTHHMPMRVQQLRGLARLFENGWFVRGWDVDDNLAVREWADANLPLALYARSPFSDIMEFGETMDIRLYRLNVRDHYLSSPFDLLMRPRDDDTIRNLADGRILRERTVQVDGAATWTLTMVRIPAGEKDAEKDAEILPVGALAGARELDPVETEDLQAESGNAGKDNTGAEVYIDGRSAGPLGAFASRGAFLDDGRHTLGIALPAAIASVSSANSPAMLWNTLDLPGGATFPAHRCSIPFPNFCEQVEYEGKTALKLIRNLGVQYWFHFPRAGTYQMRIDGVHDRPGPVILDVGLDFQSQGLVAFDRADNTWDERWMPLQIERAGLHSIAVNLVSAPVGAWNRQPDEETSAILGDITLRRLAEGQPPRDERARLGGSQRRTPRSISIPVFSSDGKSPLPNWGFLGQVGAITADPDRPMAPFADPTVKVDIPYQAAQSIGLIAPRMPISPGVSHVGAEALMGDFDFRNHTVTLGILFFDREAAGQPMPQSALFGQEGVWRTAESLRFAALAKVPPGARFYAPMIHVYPNGARPGVHSEWVRVARVRASEY